MLKFLLFIGSTFIGCLDSSSAIARSILTSEGLAHYPPILQLETGVGERFTQLKIEPKVQYLSAIPNPADQQVTISVKEMDTKARNCTIIITDSNGKVIKTQTLANGQSSFVWHTTNQAAGIYFARLLVGENQRDELKIVIQR
jgi:Secretion system C-terminal sorting domain